jgi:hypothetical protein
MTVHTGNDYARTSLPLPQEIAFNNEPLYDRFVLPAINKLTAEKPIERIKTPTTQKSDTPTPEARQTSIFTPPTTQPTTF